MSDPFSIIGGVFGLSAIAVKLIISFSEYVDSVRGAKASVQAISVDVSTVHAVLGQLKLAFETPEAANYLPQWGETFRPLLEHCKETLLSMEKMVKKAKLVEVQSGMDRLVRSIKWEFKEEDVQTLRGMLRDDKANLQLVRDVVSRQQDDEAMWMLRDISKRVGTLASQREGVKETFVVVDKENPRAELQIFDKRGGSITCDGSCKKEGLNEPNTRNELDVPIGPRSNRPSNDKATQVKEPPMNGLSIDKAVQTTEPRRSSLLINKAIQATEQRSSTSTSSRAVQVTRSRSNTSLSDINVQVAKALEEEDDNARQYSKIYDEYIQPMRTGGESKEWEILKLEIWDRQDKELLSLAGSGLTLSFKHSKSCIMTFHAHGEAKSTLSDWILKRNEGITESIVSCFRSRGVFSSQKLSQSKRATNFELHSGTAFVAAQPKDWATNRHKLTTLIWEDDFRQFTNRGIGMLFVTFWTYDQRQSLEPCIILRCPSSDIQHPMIRELSVTFASYAAMNQFVAVFEILTREYCRAWRDHVATVLDLDTADEELVLQEAMREHSRIDYCDV